MKALVVAEHDNRMLRGRTQSVIGAGCLLGGAVEVLVAGFQCGAVVEQAARLAGVSRVRQIDAAHYEYFLAENLAMVVAQMASGYSHVLLPATSFGKNLGPRIAAMLDVAQVSEIVRIVDADTFVHPIHAGNLLETVRCDDPVRVITVRPSAFAAVGMQERMAPIEAVAAGPDMGVSRFIRRELGDQDRPDLAQARVVVAGGRGLGSPEAFRSLLGPLADSLGAAIGATRAAVDCNYIGNDCQIGQTGKAVAPAVYFAVGISGAAQHLAGMRESGLIVAINKDADAPIFQIADIGMVGDLHEIVPRLIAGLRA